MYRYLLFVLIQLVTLTAYAAPIDVVFTVSGQIHAQDGEAVVATVYFKHTSISTTTDYQGHFTLQTAQVDGKPTLVVSALGYKTYEKPLEARKGTQQLDIELQPVNTQLNEATVTRKTTSRLDREKGFAISGYLHTEAKATLVDINLADISVGAHITFDIPASTFDQTEKAYVSRIDAPAISGGKAYYGLTKKKQETAAWGVLLADVRNRSAIKMVGAKLTAGAGASFIGVF